MNVITSFIDRLEFLREYLNIESGRQFAERIGISHGNYMSYKRGVQPSLDKMINILSRVDLLNPAWLIRGDEPIFLKNENYLGSVEEPKEKYEVKGYLVQTLESQQRTIESQQETIRILSNEKNDTAGNVVTAPAGEAI